MRVIRIVLIILFNVSLLFAQKPYIEKIEPPNWWSGMKLNSIQLMVYGKNLNNISVYAQSPGIKVMSVEKTDNPDYAFINISISPETAPGDYKLIFSKNDLSIEKQFSLLKRESGSKHKGFSSEDVIYLIMPDRFANGDELNDNASGFIDPLNRKNRDGRHGGDIQGIIDNLPYFKNLGISALWLTPLVENNTPMSYHGYGATDFYKIDPRLGTNQLYKTMVDKAHKNGIKIIIDHVSNHFHKNHVWTKNLPVNDWIHGTVENHQPADHNKMVFVDPYRDSSSLEKVSRGWFTNYLADLNQANSLVKNYIIQNTIWWIEYAGLDGIREDTYPYSDQKFLSGWAKVVLDEYPELNIVGEIWTGEPVFLSAFQKGSTVRGFESYLPAVTDFGLRDSYYEFLTGKGTLFNIYETLTKDYLYRDTDNLVTFIDNHDIARGLYYADGNLNRMKIALTLLLTTRGIPQLLYGTETNIPGGESHGDLRFDFPGGFPDDTLNYFTSSNLSADQKDYFSYLQKLLSLRKKFRALSGGRLTHFPPAEGIYTYFKKSDTEEFIIIINEKNDNRIIYPDLYEKYLTGKKIKDIFTEQILDYNDKISIPAVSSRIFKIE